MNSKTLMIAALTGIFAVTAAAPAFSAPDPAKREQRMKRFIARLDADKDGRVSATELAERMAVTFAAIDTDKDGSLSSAELEKARDVLKAKRQQAKADGQKRPGFGPLPLKRINKMFSKLDANKDGLLSQDELTSLADRMFKRHDRNKDGFLSADDLKA